MIVISIHKLQSTVYHLYSFLNTLEIIDKNQQYPSRDDKNALAKTLNIDENKIQVWFQNRRARDRHLADKIPEQKPSGVENLPYI